VNLAPQLVQVVNAYPLRLPCDLISFKQESHIVVSVGILTPLLPGADGMMEKPLIKGSNFLFSISIESITASGGICPFKTRINSLPSSTSITTSEPSFHTLPLRPSDEAIRCTAGLNPTPCTVPLTTIRIIFLLSCTFFILSVLDVGNKV